MYFLKQKFFVAGMSKSGEGVARFLLEKGAEIYIYDDVLSPSVKIVMSDMQDLGANIVVAEDLDKAISLCDVLVLSPGIPIDTSLAISFKKQGKAIIGESELAALYLKATVIAVTGTNGKTTTVSMIGDALSAAKLNARTCGNIGNPIIDEVENAKCNDILVAEISSFQLETLSSLRPHIAVITNITEDHLNRHYNMENYIYLKSKILKNLRESEFAVLNYDDDRVRSLARNSRGKVVFFSLKHRVDGVFVANNEIYFKDKKCFDVGELALKETHNIYNALTCIAVCGIMGLDMEIVRDTLCKFKGIKHRNQLVKELDGKKFIDDSKGTNVDATLKAAESMADGTVILLGGKDKGYDYDYMFSELLKTKVVHAVLYGENRFKLMESAIKSGFNAFSMCSEFENAVRLAAIIAKSGQTVLLSPASSSFDSFANYEARGDAFLEIVNSLEKSD